MQVTFYRFRRLRNPYDESIHLMLLLKYARRNVGKKIVGKKRDNLNLLFLPRGQLPNYLNLISLLFTAISKCKNSVFHIRTTEHWF